MGGYPIREDDRRMDEAEFESVIDAARAGAEWAWSRLYHHLAGPVLGYLRSRGASEPEDALGEVFLQVARNTPGFRGDYRAYRSWVFMVAHNRVIDERRRRSRRPLSVAPAEDTDQGGGDVEDEALAGLATEGVVTLLGRLTDDQRNVLLLRVVGDLSLEQTAEVLGKKVGAIKALQRRAIARLRKTITGAYPDGVPRRLRG
jgi:RNA polymerase sigma-70 factor (ECF subfamily)